MMPLRRLLAPLALAAALAPAALADEMPELPESLPEELKQLLQEAIEAKRLPAQTFSINFGGGTVTEYLEAIRTACPSANIVGAEGLEHYTVPAIALKNVTVSGALNPLSVIAKPGDDRIGIISVMNDNAVSSVWINLSHTGWRRSDVVETPRVDLDTFVWNSKLLTDLGYVTIDQLTAAVETALSVFDDAPAVRFHEGTGILVVRGTESQIEAVQKVIEQLNQAPPGWKELYHAVRSRQAETDALREQSRTLELLIAQLEERRKSIEIGEESDRLDSELMSRRSELRTAKAKLQAMEESLQAAKQRASANTATR